MKIIIVPTQPQPCFLDILLAPQPANKVLSRFLIIDLDIDSSP